MKNESLQSNEEYFVPLNRNMEYWDLTKKMIFFDKFFELQLNDKSNLDYKILPEYKTKINKLEIDLFCDKLLYFFYKEFNSLHNVNFTLEHWKSLLLGWLKHFVIDIYFKIEEFENLYKIYPEAKFTSCIPSDLNSYEFLKIHTRPFEDDNYHLFVSSLIAKKIYNFNILYKTETLKNRETEQVIHKEFDTDGRTSKVLRKITLKKIFNKFLFYIKNLRRIVFSILNKSSLYLWCTYFDGETIDYFKNKSHSSIKTFSLKKIEQCNVCDMKKREYLHNRISDFFSFESEIWKKACISIIIDFLPYYFLEDFRKLYLLSKSFLKKHKDMKIVFATCLYCLEEEPFFIAYARSKGVKVLTKQHGGNYGLSYDVYNNECNLADIFYSWGRWGNFVHDTDCNFIASPSYRNFLLFRNVLQKSDYILYVGGSLDYHCHTFLTCFKGKKSNIEYINRQISFFYSLSENTKSKFLVRNFWLDYGYNINRILDENVSNLKIQNYKQLDYCKNFNPVSRNDSFRDTLINCSLMIYDDIETPFVEALYCDKPFILLLDRNRYIFRPEELPFVDMMEAVGIIQYDTVEAAKYINKISDNIDFWWNDSKRQEVVQIIRERYCMKVDNPKEWWYKEFKRQLKLCKHNKVEYE
ncbi:MAG: LIC12162 family protein [Treponema sp.]|nr:LIC12162 family protein [Treponema sp.]